MTFTLSLPSPHEPLLALFRQICVLLARGETAAAAHLAGEPLARAIASLPATATLSEPELQALFEVEKERVANASVLAEILLPSLTALVSAARPTRPDTTSIAPGVLPATALFPRSSPAPSRGPGEIADFIDEMLSQERPAPRSARAS